MRWWPLLVLLLAFVVVERKERVTDGGRLQALQAVRTRQEHKDSIRDARRARRRERTARRHILMHQDGSGTFRTALKHSVHTKHYVH
ncbi:hypothetical protein DUNSADRAFT_17644 [Dunaliella salina]|uniref:Encoded protein n=1 Tax=Dunaliella salina TaxID=3046 RepID=A0ABQ7G1E9_DUNSA|nr:hypothetical protein DUNSADRAFT_17644 [Dunaliella salina]|eukprot:KAF5828426.1 hypothetical protein DUNSADRAFT_17644 [Dunaliella salina]